jgi:hypothetical protein
VISILRVEFEGKRTYGESEFGLKDCFCLQSAAFLPFLPAPSDPTCFKSDIVILKQFTDTNLLTHIPHFPQNHT